MFPFPLQPQHQQQPPVLANSSVRFSIESARSLYKQRAFSDSILNYIAVLKSQSIESRRHYLSEFLDSLRAYLQEETNESNIGSIFQVSAAIYETEFQFWRLKAEHFYNKGELLNSMQMFETAGEHAKSELEKLVVAASIANIRSSLFDAWHWRMINDAKRNNKFAAAIQEALKTRPNALVLDIGCGSGIFSVVAARDFQPSPGCAYRTFACDQIEVMCKIAASTFDLNGVEVALFEKHSTGVDLGGMGNNKKCGILISETLDSAIFGERIVETILDAKERLLENDAIVIPKKAIALFSLIESISLQRENVHQSEKVALISHWCYLHELDGNRIIPPLPYNCAHLNELPEGFRLLSTPTEGLAVDFNNVQQLKQIKNDRFLTEVVLTTTQRGLASAVAVWFRLNLFGEHEICTAPDEGHSWQQAVFPFYPPQEVVPGQAFRFEVFVKANALHVHPLGLQHSPTGFDREVVRAPPCTDLTAINDQAVRAFFRTAGASGSGPVLDCTDLLISERFAIASGQSVIRYIGRDAVSLEKATCAPDGAILFWPFSGQGSSLVDDYLTSVFHLRTRCPQTTLIPSQIRLRGCLINSDQLVGWSGLLDGPGRREDTYCDVDLSPMDEYRVSHFHEVQTRTLAHEQLSEPVDVFSICLDFGKEVNIHTYADELIKVGIECVFTCNSGREEGALCHAVLYWFQLVDPAGNTLDLGRQTHSPLPSAFILPRAKHLKAGDQLKARVSLLHGDVLFHWVKDVLFL